MHRATISELDLFSEFFTTGRGTFSQPLGDNNDDDDDDEEDRSSLLSEYLNSHTHLLLTLSYLFLLSRFEYACRTVLKRFGDARGLKCVLAFLTSVDVWLLWSDGDLI